MTSLAIAGVIVLAVVLILSLVGLGVWATSSNESVYGPFCGFWLSMQVWDFIFQMIGVVLQFSAGFIAGLLSDSSD